ncbi:UNVERIFIED_CONTAM: hypothetical protein K2H54_002090 [Gekko kuhli]
MLVRGRATAEGGSHRRTTTAKERHCERRLVLYAQERQQQSGVLPPERTEPMETTGPSSPPAAGKPATDSSTPPMTDVMPDIVGPSATPAALHTDIVLLQDTRLYRDTDLRAAERQWRRWGPSLWTPAEAAGTAPKAEAGGGRHRAMARGKRTTVAQPRGGTALLGRWSNASWTMQVVERPDRHGRAHVIDIAMNPRHLRGQGSGSGKQLMHPSYGAVPQPDAAATTITAATDPEGTATAGTGDDGQVPFRCQIVHIVDGEPAGGHGGPQNRARQRWEAATIVQQLRCVLTTGTTHGMHTVAETCTASGGGSRGLLATHADGGHRHGTEPVCIGQLAATSQCRRPGADDRQRLEAVLREVDLADVTDPEDYGSRPGAAPRLERFPMLGRPTQHVANAATAAATAPDDPWHCPTTPYTERYGSPSGPRALSRWPFRIASASAYTRCRAGASHAS